MQEAKRAVIRFIITAVVSFLLYLVQYVLTYYAENGKLPDWRSSGSVGFTAHEQEIAANVVAPEAIDVRLDDIGGLKAVKEDIRAQVLVPLQHPEIFFGDVDELYPPRGILLHGPPGTGKTMLARAIAAEAGCPFLALSLSNLENKWFGETSKLLGATFSLARKMQPCVLFFDEIDGMIRTRNDNDQSAVYGFKTEFLSHMDGIRTNKRDSFIVIACTNCVRSLDPAIKRRLPQQYKIDYPDADDLASIVRVHLRKSGLATGIVDVFAGSMRAGVTGSDVEELVKATWAYQRKKMLLSREFTEKIANGTVDAQTLQRSTGKMKLANLMHVARERGLIAAEG